MCDRERGNKYISMWVHVSMTVSVCMRSIYVREKQFHLQVDKKRNMKNVDA